MNPEPTIPPPPRCILCWDEKEIEYCGVESPTGEKERPRSPCPNCMTVEYREWVTRRYHEQAEVEKKG